MTADVNWLFGLTHTFIRWRVAKDCPIGYICGDDYPSPQYTKHVILLFVQGLLVLLEHIYFQPTFECLDAPLHSFLAQAERNFKG